VESKHAQITHTSAKPERNFCIREIDLCCVRWFPSSKLIIKQRADSVDGDGKEVSWDKGKLEIAVGGKKKECSEKNKEKNELKQCPK